MVDQKIFTEHYARYLGRCKDAKTSSPTSSSQEGGCYKCWGICRYTNNYIREQNKNHRTVGTMAVHSTETGYTGVCKAPCPPGPENIIENLVGDKVEAAQQAASAWRPPHCLHSQPWAFVLPVFCDDNALPPPDAFPTSCCLPRFPLPALCL